MQKSLKGLVLATLVTVLGTGISIFGQADVARRTTAITYPPDDTVLVGFRGTTRFPRMKGDAKVKRTARSGTRIELSVDKMPRPFELGAGYATYVLWAISPTGQADNLGEIKRSGLFFIDSKITVTTPLQTFAMIITAEPHFLVSRPSQTIMLENLNPVGSNGQRISTTPSISYFGNSSDFFRDPRTPEIAEIDYSRTPSAILQAKQAVALARYSGADRDAAVEMQEAETLLQNAENAWRADRDSDTIDITARRSITASVKAETLAAERRGARERRNEQTRSDAEIRAAESRVTDVQSEMTDLREELARERRNRELAERDVLNYSNQVKDLRDENGRLREDVGRMRTEIETINSRLTTAQNEKQAAEQSRDRETKAARIKGNESTLMTSLKRFGTVAKEADDIVLTLPESFFAGPRSADFAAATDGKLALLGQLLVENPDYRITVESHTDNSGSPEQIQGVTDRRSYAIADKFSNIGIEEGRIVAKGLGASLPVAPNTTAASRAKNRRLRVVLSMRPV